MTDTHIAGVAGNGGRPVGLATAADAASTAPSAPLIRDRSAVARIPLLPRWGATRQSYLLRSAVVVNVVTAVSLVLILAVSSRWAHAAGISILVPGGGFLYDGWPILFAATWVAFWLGWNFWVGFGSIFHLGLAYLLSVAGGIALADGPRPGFASTTNWPWAIPALLLVAALYVLHHLYNMQRGYQRDLATRDERNQYLASLSTDVIEQVISSFDSPSHRPGAASFDPVGVSGSSGQEPPLPVTDADAALVKWLLRLSMQPVESFDGWDWGAEAAEASALRYQVNEIGYSLAYLQANYLPAYPSLLETAQRNVIAKAQEMPVWGYWFGEEFWGNLRRQPDPIVGAKLQNIMFTGFLAKHLTHYEAATHDHRYDEPGALKFTWPDGRSWSYSFPEIAAHCSRAFAESPFTLWPCEPNQVYTVCNQMGAAGVQGFDSLHDTTLWERVSERYQRALDDEWMRPNGDYYGHFNTRLGMNVGALTWNDGTGPMFMDGNHAIVGFGRTMSPEIAARLYLLGKNTETFSMLPIVDGTLRLPPAGAGDGNAGRLARLLSRVPSVRHFLSGAWVDMSKSGYPASNAVMYAGIADLARQFGNTEITDAAIRGLDAEHFLGLTAERPYAATVHVLSMIAKTRWARRYKQDDFLCGRIPCHEGPLLASAPYPQVLVTYANGRDGLLCLTLEPTSGPGNFRLTFERLRPDTAYVAGSDGTQFRTSADGTGAVTIPLSGRTTIVIQPSGSR